MNLAQIDQWEFEMPEGMHRKQNSSSNSYFETEDRTVGLYVKCVKGSEHDNSASQLAELIQNAHLHAFTQGIESTWKIVNQTLFTDSGLVRSTIDLYDASANYRVLSFVVSSRQSAIQVTVHDYWCEDYQSTINRFSAIESSISARVISA
jgi:hypothetical protein